MKKSYLVLTVLCLVLFANVSAARLTVLHGIPGDSVAESLDRALPVDVYVNQDYSSGPAFTFRFKEVVEDLELPAGEYMFEVFLAGTNPTANGSEPVLSATALLSENGNYTAVAHLTYTGEAPGIVLSLFENETSPITPGETRLTARHLANAPAVTLDIQRVFPPPFRFSGAFVKVPGFANGEEAVLEFRAGRFEAGVLAGGMPVFSAGSLRLERHKHYLVYAIGDFFKGSFDVHLQVIE